MKSLILAATVALWGLGLVWSPAVRHASAVALPCAILLLNRAFLRNDLRRARQLAEDLHGLVVSDIEGCGPGVAIERPTPRGTLRALVAPRSFRVPRQTTGWDLLVRVAWDTKASRIRRLEIGPRHAQSSASPRQRAGGLGLAAPAPRLGWPAAQGDSAAPEPPPPCASPRQRARGLGLAAPAPRLGWPAAQGDSAALNWTPPRTSPHARTIGDALIDERYLILSNLPLPPLGPLTLEELHNYIDVDAELSVRTGQNSVELRLRLDPLLERNVIGLTEAAFELAEALTAEAAGPRPHVPSDPPGGRGLLTPSVPRLRQRRPSEAPESA